MYSLLAVRLRHSCFNTDDGIRRATIILDMDVPAQRRLFQYR